MKKLSDEEKAILKAKIEEIQTNSRVTKRPKISNTSRILIKTLIIIVFVVTGGLISFVATGAYISYNSPMYNEWGFGYIIINVPIGIITGAIIGFILIRRL